MKLSHLAVGGVAVLALLLGACSSSDDAKDADSDKSTTTTEATTESTDTIAPTTTLADDDYSTAVAAFDRATTDAAGDLCALVVASSTAPLSDPASAEQAKLFVDANISWLQAVAATRPADQAEAINSTVVELREFFEKYDYDVDKTTAASAELEALQNPAYTDAMSAVQADAAACAPGGASTEPTTGE